MIATVHALVGAAIASKIHDPILTPVLALGSHFVLDSIPHWDFGTNWKGRSKALTGAIAIMDTIFGIGLAITLYAPTTPIFPLLLGIAAAELPDWLEAPWYIFFATKDNEHTTKNSPMIARILHGLYVFQNKFHARAQFPLGVLTQAAALTFFLFLLR